jgi:hypothetical protein
MTDHCAHGIGQRGASLPFALVAMAVGVLLVIPFLGYLATSYKSTRAAEENFREEYTSDAGVEYAIHKLGDPSLQETLVNKKRTPETLGFPQPVNTIVPTVEVVCVEAEPIAADWNWTLWVSDTLTIEKNNTEISGDVRCSELIDEKDDTIFHGEVITDDVTTDWPVTWELANFELGSSEVLTEVVEADDDGEYHFHDYSESTWDGTHWVVDSADDLPVGVHYYPGNLEIIDNNQTWVTVTVVASGTISVNHGNSLTFKKPYIEGLTFFANAPSDKAIMIDGNKFTMEDGICYAPNGAIELVANKDWFSGSFVSEDVRISKNNTIIQEPLDVSMPGFGAEGFCGVYDIRSRAGSVTTSVRITRCAQEAPEILVWHVD